MAGVTGMTGIGITPVTGGERREEGGEGGRELGK
jgi:hypothetical protein